MPPKIVIKCSPKSIRKQGWSQTGFGSTFWRKKGPLDPRGLASRLGAVLKITYSPISHFSAENHEKVSKILSKIRSKSEKNLVLLLNYIPNLSAAVNWECKDYLYQIENGYSLMLEYSTFPRSDLCFEPLEGYFDIKIVDFLEDRKRFCISFCTFFQPHSC